MGSNASYERRCECLIEKLLGIACAHSISWRPAIFNFGDVFMVDNEHELFFSKSITAFIWPCNEKKNQLSCYSFIINSCLKKNDDLVYRCNNKKNIFIPAIRSLEELEIWADFCIFVEVH